MSQLLPLRNPWTLRRCAAIVLLLVVVGIVTTGVSRYRQMRFAVALLARNGVSVNSAPSGLRPWHDRLPWISPLRIHAVEIWPHTNLELIVPVLAELGTVTRLEYHELTVQELELVSQIESIETISSHRSSVTAEHLRPFMSHRICDFSVEGPDLNMPDDVLEMLYSIPSLERIGTAHGREGVPEALRLKRPEVVIYLTDFPA